MKLGRFRESKRSASRRVSELCQTSALGGIAAIWALKDPSKGHGLTHGFIFPMICFVIALGVDFSQHVWRASAWTYMARQREKPLEDKSDEQEVEDPAGSVNLITAYLFYGKILIMLLGFVFFIKAALPMLSE